jgi:uncharacterized membrane protein
MKQRFITGLIIILPLIITVWIFLFLIRVCTQPFAAATQATLSNFQIFQDGCWGFSETQVIFILSTMIILCGLYLILFVVGFICNKFLFHVVIHAFERLLLKVPLFNKVYKACHDFTNVLLSPKSSSFSKVVWIPFPTTNQASLGLVTNERLIVNSKKYTSVFVPGTPNPTVGFLLLCPEELLTPTTLPIDVGMKWVISCGSSMNDPVMRTTYDLQMH